MKLKVKSIGRNQTEIQTGEMVILVSYETPVAMVKNSGDYSLEPLKTSEFHSVTTNRHVNDWFREMGFNPAEVTQKPQKFFDDLI